MLARLPTLSRPPLRVWCFDVEAAPSAWAGSDFCYKRMICGASAFEGEQEWWLPLRFTERSLEWFVRPLREPGVLVVGHNVTYDLEAVSGTLPKFGLPPLTEPVLITDTKAHIPRNGYFYSRRLADMAKRFGCEHVKGEMDPYDWEQVAMGDPDAIRKLADYNVTDVRVTLELRAALIAAELLEPPRTWRPRR